MRPWRKVFIFIAVGVVFVSLLVAWGMREPRYQGRTLTSWLDECVDTATEDNRQLNEAQLAIRAIGSEKVLPYLMRMIRARDGRIKSWVIRRSENWKWGNFKPKRAEVIHGLGIAGFYGLGTNAAAAVPELTRMLDDTNQADAAVRCLTWIGEPARTPVCQALTNVNSKVRYMAALRLELVIDDPRIYLEQIKGCLKDPDGDVRSAAVWGIGAHTNAPGLAIPLLVTALEDQDDLISRTSAMLLGDFGTNALRAFGALTNALGSGKPKTANEALITLVTIAPRETLPILLERLRSDDVDKRRRALGILCRYPVESPEIRPTIERAAADKDAVVSRRAKEFITKQQGGLRGNQPLAPGEPVYAGKALGEWLKESKKRGRKIDGLFTKEAEEAIRQMGTNAIPALLQRLVYVQPPYGLKATEVNMEAVMAFITLRELARPARPQLMELMDSKDEDTALHAMVASFGMGVDALPCAFKGLTNKHMMVRSEAANFLEQGQGAEFKLKRKEAVPMLLKLLKDPSESVRETAESTLREIDPEAAKKAGIK